MASLAEAISSIVAAAAFITSPPRLAASADSRLTPTAVSALSLISPMVAVISCAAAAIWLILLVCVCVLPLVWDARAQLRGRCGESLRSLRHGT